jgi:hypothetical protein
MKKIFFFIAFLLTVATSFAQTSTYVSGYTKSNGAYVQGHYRTSPNSTRNDNYSTVGNTNPYTGSYGTKPASNYTPTNTYTTPSAGNTSYNAKPTYTGSRGGSYYINSNGNKTYINN